jgi:NIMA (never in mitosis gene a)-related kinase
VDGHIYAMKKVEMRQLKVKEKENALNEVRLIASFDDQNII